MQTTDFPLIRAAISPRRAAQFDTALANVKAFAAEGVLIKAEWNEIKDTFSRAIDETWDAFRKEQYYPRAREGENEAAVSDLYSNLLFPYPYALAGYLKRVQSAKNIEPAILRDFPIAFFTEALPLNEMLVSLKPLIGKRAPKRTAKEIEREGHARTCQVCGRGILAEGGVIAHHGYQRPGEGWQTPSCNGAREVPFEIARDALGAEIMRLEAWRDAEIAARKRYADETAALWIRYDVSIPDPRSPHGFKKTVTETLSGVTRATFDSLKVTEPQAFAGKNGPWIKEKYRYEPFTFDSLKAQILGSIDHQLALINSTITQQQARYDGWKQTLVFVDGAYQPFLGEN